MSGPKKKDDGLPTFDHVIFHHAEIYLEAAERCLETRPDDNGELNSLLMPSEHCAVIACELFIKSLGAFSTFERIDEGGVNQRFSRAKKGHDRLLDTVNGWFSEQIYEQLTGSEKCFLNALKERLMASRYPYEPSAGRYDAKSLEVARRLQAMIRARLKPDLDGRIRIG